jgi:hypothetical protein
MSDLTEDQRLFRGCRPLCTSDTHEAGCTSNDAVIGAADPEVAARKALARQRHRHMYGDPTTRYRPTSLEMTPSGAILGVSPNINDQIRKEARKVRVVSPDPYAALISQVGEGSRRFVDPLPKALRPPLRQWIGWKLIKLGRKIAGIR